mgnify:CR=1 FL=1
MDVRRGATAGFSGVSVSYRDLADFQAVTGQRIDPYEAEAILSMDGAFNAAIAAPRGKAGE